MFLVALVYRRLSMDACQWTPSLPIQPPSSFSIRLCGVGTFVHE